MDVRLPRNTVVASVTVILTPNIYGWRKCKELSSTVFVIYVIDSGLVFRHRKRNIIHKKTTRVAAPRHPWTSQRGPTHHGSRINRRCHGNRNQWPGWSRCWALSYSGRRTGGWGLNSGNVNEFSWIDIYYGRSAVSARFLSFVPTPDAAKIYRAETALLQHISKRLLHW